MKKEIRVACWCRTCGKKYDEDRSRADYKGYCTQTCLRKKAREHGWGKGIVRKFIVNVLAEANELGSVLCYDVPPAPCYDVPVAPVVKKEIDKHSHHREKDRYALYKLATQWISDYKKVPPTELARMPLENQYLLRKGLNLKEYLEWYRRLSVDDKIAESKTIVKEVIEVSGYKHDKQLKDDKQVVAAFERVLKPLDKLWNMSTVERIDIQQIGAIVQQLQTMKDKYEVTE